ncbi:MAG: YiaA/YiaB family inner membrane protein [Puia sp.]|nr:YiaA/YiaB family inner membrane protein [Puia sp.]
MTQKPSNAFIAASWIALGVGMAGYLVGLWRAEMLLNEKGFYAFAFLLAMFGAITVQKNTRDSQQAGKKDA